MENKFKSGLKDDEQILFVERLFDILVYFDLKIWYMSYIKFFKMILPGYDLWLVFGLNPNTNYFFSTLYF